MPNAILTQPSSTIDAASITTANRTITPRDTLEIIVDTCSLGGKQLELVDRLIAHVRATHPPVFHHVRLVIPVQIASEFQRRIFPEFLIAELSFPLFHESDRMRLREFYQKHLDSVAVVETNVSQAYKFMYAKHALAILTENTELNDRVFDHACELATRYTSSIEGITVPTREAFNAVCEGLQQRLLQQEASMGRAREGVRAARKNGHVRRHKTLAAHLESAEMRSMARHGEKLFDSMPPTERCIIQAMYSEPNLNKEVSIRNDFKAFRADKGERAIESYLFNERYNHDASVASLVVSDDGGARDAINLLRNSNHNTVLVVSSNGLRTAMRYIESGNIPASKHRENSTDLRLENNADLRWRDHPKNPARELIDQARQQHPHQYQKLNLAIEGDWALRLAEMTTYGDWTRQPERSITPS